MSCFCFQCHASSVLAHGAAMYCIGVYANLERVFPHRMCYEWLYHNDLHGPMISGSGLSQRLYQWFHLCDQRLHVPPSAWLRFLSLLQHFMNSYPVCIHTFLPIVGVLLSTSLKLCDDFHFQNKDFVEVLNHEFKWSTPNQKYWLLTPTNLYLKRFLVEHPAMILVDNTDFTVPIFAHWERIVLVNILHFSFGNHSWDIPGLLRTCANFILDHNIGGGTTHETHDEFGHWINQLYVLIQATVLPKSMKRKREDGENSPPKRQLTSLTSFTSSPMSGLTYEPPSVLSFAG